MSWLERESVRIAAVVAAALVAQLAAYVLTYAVAHRSPGLLEVACLGLASVVTAVLVLFAMPAWKVER